MTDQYQPFNINNPRGSRTVTAALVTMTLDDDLVVADSTANTILLDLPDAVTIPGNTVWIKVPVGSTFAVTIAGAGGQTIDGAASLVLNTDEAAAILKSDGANWQIISSTALVVPGLLSIRETAITGPLTTSDGVVLGDAVGGAITLTLPPVTGTTGTNMTVKKIDASGNGVIIEGSGAETIDTALNATITIQFASITMVSDGTEWWII